MLRAGFETDSISIVSMRPTPTFLARAAAVEAKGASHFDGDSLSIHCPERIFIGPVVTEGHHKISREFL
jgi:hypothetical protein